MLRTYGTPKSITVFMLQTFCTSGAIYELPGLMKGANLF